MKPLMKIAFAGMVPKDASRPGLIEDAYSVYQSGSLVATCDGASESYDSKFWATLLVHEFLRNPQIDKLDWLNNVISYYKQRFNFNKMTWSQQAAFQRGSFSTLLGLKFLPEKDIVKITSIGDTVALLVNEDGINESFPYKLSEEFLQRPVLLSTNLGQNGFLNAEDFLSLHTKEWKLDYQKSPHILIMTDALAEWTLRKSQQNDPVWKAVIQIDATYKLKEFVTSARSSLDMRVDDVTLINIAFENN